MILLILILLSPNFTHIDVIKKVLVANKHLLIEKPMCTNVDDCFNYKKLLKIIQVQFDSYGVQIHAPCK